LAAGALENTPANLARWLANPQAVKPGNHMPDLRLPDADVRALVAYLEALQ
jgi:cytochrome c oxidase subunit 2